MINTFVDFLGLIGIVLGGFFVWAALSPFETLGWWAGWFGDKIYDEPVPTDGLFRVIPPAPNSYVLFLSGVGRTSSETLSFREKSFLERLARQLPNSVVIDDLFPYAVNNLALTDQPIFARLWRRALRWKLRGPRFAGNLINLRNIFQILMSADKRYGPLFNQGVAEVLLHSLLRYNYVPESKIPVLLVASSGSAQIAVSVVPYLKEWIQAPIYVVSVGGIFSSNIGLLKSDQLYHLYGTRDVALRWSNADAGRWPWMHSSYWNRALRQGKVSQICLGTMCHTGRGSYLDFKTKLPDGQSYLDKTVKNVVDIVHDVSAPEASVSVSTS